MIWRINDYLSKLNRELFTFISRTCEKSKDASGLLIRSLLRSNDLSGALQFQSGGCRLEEAGMPGIGKQRRDSCRLDAGSPAA